jgi:cellulose/xylan binding protein with CBM9 domain
MPKTRARCGALVFLLAPFIVGQDSRDARLDREISRYVVKRTLGPIAIDGVLDEPSWKAAASTGPFRLNDGSGYPKSNVEARILWDETNLYFAFQCEDTDIYATMKKRDQHLWEEEVVEIFIDPDGDQRDYIELEINPLGTFLDLFVLRPVIPIPYESYNIPARWAVKVDGTVKISSDKDRGWAVELSMPLQEAVTAANFPPKEGDKWRLNLYRIEQRPLAENTAWSPTLTPSYHTPERFGEISFSLQKVSK